MTCYILDLQRPSYLQRQVLCSLNSARKFRAFEAIESFRCAGFNCKCWQPADTAAVIAVEFSDRGENVATSGLTSSGFGKLLRSSTQRSGPLTEFGLQLRAKLGGGRVVL